MTRRTRRKKPPRMVLLDLRTEADMKPLMDSLRGLVGELTSQVIALRDQVQILSLENERRSDRARRANQTRRQQTAPEQANGPTGFAALEEPLNGG